MLRRRRIGHTSPEEKDQTTRRKATGSRGGRSPTFDPDRYRALNVVERVLARLKRWRGIAIRTDKHARTLSACVTLAAIIMHTHTNWETRPRRDEPRRFETLEVWCVPADSSGGIQPARR